VFSLLYLTDFLVRPLENRLRAAPTIRTQPISTDAHS
jgi:hypothetical protein